jgi:hypothetical protein
MIAPRGGELDEAAPNEPDSPLGAAVVASVYADLLEGKRDTLGAKLARTGFWRYDRRVTWAMLVLQEKMWRMPPALRRQAFGSRLNGTPTVEGHYKADSAA